MVIADLDSGVCQASPGAGCSPGQYGSAVRVVESNGVISASRVIQGEITISSPSIGDLTGDGYPEIAFTSGSCFRYQSGCGAGNPPSNGAERLMHVLDHNLNDVFAPRALKNAAQTSPALLDVNGGTGEIAVTDNEGWLYLFDAAGNQLWATCGRSSTAACRTGIYGATPSIGTDASPVAGDGDRDGMFLFTSNNTNGVGSYSWPAFRGNTTDRQGAQGTLARIDYPSTADGQFIAKVYVDLLGRQVDGSGLSYWYAVVRNSGRASFAGQRVYARPHCEQARTVVATSPPGQPTTTTSTQVTGHPSAGGWHESGQAAGPVATGRAGSRTQCDHEPG